MAPFHASSSRAELTSTKLGTVIAEDTGELVIQGTKSRKKDSDAESFASRGLWATC